MFRHAETLRTAKQNLNANNVNRMFRHAHEGLCLKFSLPLTINENDVQACRNIAYRKTKPERKQRQSDVSARYRGVTAV